MNNERELDLMDGLRRAIGIARWMSGSKDFGPEGQAAYGWQKAKAELDDMEKLITGIKAIPGGFKPFTQGGVLGEK